MTMTTAAAAAPLRKARKKIHHCLALLPPRDEDGWLKSAFYGRWTGYIQEWRRVTLCQLLSKGEGVDSSSIV